ncbi:hypothetical protein [Sporosarcina highlanderae]|uniref:DUF1700 domain-containing protein n=1 Tax=Sporosarcina highlanderae TaxID=3035916 RepID=A0ABT8JPH5_9BACL|nr:hypothetical protein [Sporosarcina highlanderae]MDN4607041.1 hypothetical protein [Sporosarcina highlanderae]
MGTERKKIIITEINYWKENKMLPEHYCDFLITLYTQGEQEQAPDITDAILMNEKKKKKKKMSSVFFHLLYIFSAFTILAISLIVCAVFFEGQSTLLIIFSAFNCLLWIVAGRFLKLIYFTISGVAGLLFIALYLFGAF